MNKKGFTLVEVLAVIVILGLIMVIVGTKGFGAFDNTKDKISKLNEDAINEAAELLKVDIEYCDDDLDEDLVENLIGTNDANRNGISKECADLHKALLPSANGGLNGIKVDLSKLIDLGYVEGAGVKEIETKEIYEVTFKKTDVNSKITYVTNIEAKRAVIVKDLIPDSYIDYRKKIVEIKFVKYVDTKNAKESWDVSSTEGNAEVKAWLENSSETNKYVLYIGSENTIYAPKISSNLFAGFSSVKNIYFENFNTSNVESMIYMFRDCRSLLSLDLSGFDTTNVEDMSYMFYYCDVLTSLNLSSFDTTNVENMSNMFYYCLDLKSLELRSFNTIKVEDMSNMFQYCQSLTSLDLSSFNTSNVKTMRYMFARCKELNQIIFGLNFRADRLEETHYMFANCESLTSLDLRNFDTANVTNMSNMFRACHSLTSLDLRNFNTTSVTNYSRIFDGVDCPMICIDLNKASKIVDQLPECRMLRCD